MVPDKVSSCKGKDMLVRRTDIFLHINQAVSHAHAADEHSPCSHMHHIHHLGSQLQLGKSASDTLQKCITAMNSGRCLASVSIANVFTRFPSVVIKCTLLTRFSAGLSHFEVQLPLTWYCIQGVQEL